MLSLRFRAVCAVPFFTTSLLLGCSVAVASVSNVIRDVPFGRPSSCDEKLARPGRLELTEVEKNVVFDEIFETVRTATASRSARMKMDQHFNIVEWSVEGPRRLRLTFRTDPRGVNSYVQVDGANPFVTYFIRDLIRQATLTTLIKSIGRYYLYELCHSSDFKISPRLVDAFIL